MRVLLLLALVFVVSGCASSFHAYNKQQPAPASNAKPVVYVTNPELGEAYEVLQASGLYELSDDASEPNQLTLSPIFNGGRTGKSFSAAVFFMGLWPIELASFNDFNYRIATPEATTSYTHSLDIYKRVSVWEWFFLPIAGSRTKALGTALASSERQQTQE